MAKKPSPVKKTVAKPAPKAKKPEAKKAKAPAPKPAPKPAAKPAAPAKAPAAKAPAAKPAPAKSAAGKPSTKPAEKAAPAAKSGPGATAPASGSGRKGITIVTPKPAKKPAVKAASKYPSLGGTLLGPGSPVRKPLIPSGPTQAKHVSLGEGADLTGKKSPFGKKELAKFKALLMQKRSELIGDVKNMEQEALRSNAGSLSNLPQHMADQGSDAYDQALALDLAAVDRRLIKEIEDALQRIENGTYGLCELTGKPIKLERLEEIPWARHSIEAAREVERRTVRP